MGRVNKEPEIRLLYQMHTIMYIPAKEEPTFGSELSDGSGINCIIYSVDTN